MKKNIFIKPASTVTILQTMRTVPSAAEEKAQAVSHNQSFVSFNVSA